MKKSRLLDAARVCFGFVLFIPNFATAAIISTHFSDGATQTGAAVGGVDASDQWNRISGAPRTGIALTDINGAATGITMDFTASFGIFTTPATSFGAGYEPLASGYLVFDGAVTLHGLAANEDFDLFLYGERNTGAAATQFTVNGAVAGTTAIGLDNDFVLNQSYVAYSGTADSSGNLTIGYQPDPPNTEGPFNGFQINLSPGASLVPVPAAVWLFGSGLLGLIGVARRKKTA